MKRVVIIAMLALLVISGLALAQEKTQITWWHAMSGSRLAVVDSIVDQFNAANPDIELTALFTGTYDETLTKFIASYQTGTGPNLVQVYEVGTQAMLGSGAIIPVYQVPDMLEQTWDWGQYIIPITNYYSKDGNLWSMPFNSSTAMLYYNKDLFVQAGLDPNKPPTTWKELEEYGVKLRESGVQNVLSTGWPGWILEQMFTTHNQLFANNDNGRSGLSTEVLFNGEFGTMVLDTWANLAKKGIFTYEGPEYSANTSFVSGQLAILLQSTSSLTGILKGAQFDVGTSFLPRFEGYPMGNSVIGGGSLWVRKGQSDEELKAVWEFLKFLGNTDIAIEWHKGTGYFPTSNSAVKTLLDEGWYSQDQNYLTAFLEILVGRRDTPAVMGVRLGTFVEIREIERTAIEKAVSGVLTPKEALDEAAQKANQLLQDYAELHS